MKPICTCAKDVQNITKAKKAKLETRLKTPKKIETTQICEVPNMEELSGEINKKAAEISSKIDGDVSFTRSGKVRTQPDKRNVPSPSRIPKTNSCSINVGNDMPDLTCNEIIQFNDPNMSQQFIDFFNDKR